MSYAHWSEQYAHEQWLRSVTEDGRKRAARVLSIPLEELNPETPVPAEHIQVVFKAIQFHNCSIDPSKLPTEDTTFSEIRKCVGYMGGGD